MDLLSALQDREVQVRAGAADDAVDDHIPGCVARPVGTGQVATVLREAHSRGAVVVVRGHGSKLTFGGVGVAPDLLLDLSGCGRLLEHQPGDLIVRVEAGMPLAALQDAVRGSSQRLGIDEPVPGSTVGGLIATNTSGPRRLHTGTARDLLIGATVVLAEGTVAHSGGKVVKNVAGYDLGKLMVGSLGTLAVVTEATFRLHPIPAQGAWVSTTVEAADLEQLLARLCDTQLAPSALEIDWPTEGSITVAMLLEGTTDGVPARIEAARAEFGVPAAVDDALDWPWHLPAATDGSETLLKLTSRLGAVAELASAAHDLGLHVRGAAGSGVLYAGVPASTGVDDLDRMVQDLRARAGRQGGAVVVLTAPLEIRRNVDVWGPVNGLPVMQRLKQEFDPGQQLAPGRFVGDI
ncbi:FAD-binding oxidoreductase [Flexivirga oryzae]|uniref:Glycolate oxidase FAD binding subunit n=1 Tax=Flexivirga oryzae TaxID=1794944 RepID=A0A839N002_9MICO|nr:FAD-binding oxidoreductase [Flexivirga oryzae]MBB2891018.1 glycolate oxidase FAD binding subunit [Flexivirga oryzae]